jgi:hypothetical protein
MEKYLITPYHMVDFIQNIFFVCYCHIFLVYIIS